MSSIWQTHAPARTLPYPHLADIVAGHECRHLAVTEEFDRRDMSLVSENSGEHTNIGCLSSAGPQSAIFEEGGGRGRLLTVSQRATVEPAPYAKTPAEDDAQQELDRFAPIET